MNVRSRTIEVDAETAEALETEAAARGVSVAELLADMAKLADSRLPPDLNAMRAAGRGPWSPEALAEDVRALEEFERTGEAVPWENVKAWMQSWGTPHELPMPKPRKL
jgi:predicted transcriptional regulator